jgi:hypothetical protein
MISGARYHLVATYLRKAKAVSLVASRLSGITHSVMKPAAPAAARSGSVSNPRASPKSQILSSQSALTCGRAVNRCGGKQRAEITHEKVPRLEITVKDVRRVDVLREGAASQLGSSEIEQSAHLESAQGLVDEALEMSVRQRLS